MRRVALVALGLVVLVGLAALGSVAWWYRSLETYGETPFGSTEEKVVEIPAGARMKDVSGLLARAGVISDEQRFHWLAKTLKLDRQIKAGEYGFSGPLLPGKVLETIAQGRVKLYHCTVPEGLRLDEVSALLEGCRWNRAADYLALARDAAFARQLGVDGDSLEGYLFPDTYSFPRNPKPDAVLRKMVEGFFQALAKAQARRRPEVTLSPRETATLASIIEKETGAAAERAHISCVFHNRLKKHMKLETDPTVIYAKILRTGRFDGDIRREDLRFPHPYNTYTVVGLPPGPIASAGLAALEAALAPADCEDLFFVACGGGTHQFCPDYECHQRFVDRCVLGKP